MTSSANPKICCHFWWSLPLPPTSLTCGLILPRTCTHLRQATNSKIMVYVLHIWPTTRIGAAPAMCTRWSTSRNNCRDCSSLILALLRIDIPGITRLLSRHGGRFGYVRANKNNVVLKVKALVKQPLAAVFHCIQDTAKSSVTSLISLSNSHHIRPCVNWQPSETQKNC